MDSGRSTANQAIVLGFKLASPYIIAVSIGFLVGNAIHTCIMMAEDYEEQQQQQQRTCSSSYDTHCHYDWQQQHFVEQLLIILQKQRQLQVILQRDEPPILPFLAVRVGYPNKNHSMCIDFKRTCDYKDPTRVCFLLNEIETMEFFLRQQTDVFNGNGMQGCLYLSMGGCDELGLEEWRTLLGILKQSLPNLNQLYLYLRDTTYAGLDHKLVLLSHDDYRFPNLKELWISLNGGGGGGGRRNPPTETIATLPEFYHSIGQLPQSLESICLDQDVPRQKYFLTLECLNNLASSITSQPNLDYCYLGEWIIPNDPDIEMGWEALCCAIASHPNLKDDFELEKKGQKYTGDVLPQRGVDELALLDLAPCRISQDCQDIIESGPNVRQVLTQLRRQGKLPPDFPEIPENIPEDGFYNGNLEGWVQVLIAVKDVQLKGKDRWDIFHFLFKQLVGILNYENCSEKYWDASDPYVRVPWIHEKRLAASVCIQEHFRRYHHKKIVAAIAIQSQIRRFLVKRNFDWYTWIWIESSDLVAADRKSNNFVSNKRNNVSSTKQKRCRAALFLLSLLRNALISTRTGG